MSDQGGGHGAGDKEQAQMPPFSVGDLGANLPATGAFTAADRAGLVNVLKDKLQFLAGQSSGFIESLSPKIKKRVEVLQSIQKQHDDLEAKFREERAALEAKYQKLYAPLYSKRFDIVTGAVEVEENKAEGETDDKAPPAKEEEKGIPDFWLTAMKTNDVLAMQITERDEGALNYLKEIKSCTLDNPKGFRLDFFFDTNPYFKNSVLSKTYHMVDEDEPILERAIGTEIDWYPGKNLTQKIMKKKPKKGAKNAKPVTKTEQCDSFFNFFNPPQVPDDEDDIDQEEAEQLQDLMEQDYDIGSTIKEKIIPHAVSWFTGEALQGDEYDLEEDDDADGDDDEDEEEEDDEDEDDDEDDDDDEPPRKPAARPKGAQTNAAGQGGSEQPPECKQQ